MSICSTGVDSSCCLRVSLIVLRSISSSVVMIKSSSFPRKREPRYSPSLKEKRSRIPRFAATTLSRQNVRARRLAVAIETRHRLVLDDLSVDRAEAVEAGPHCAAVGAEHADLDIIARADVAGKHERPGHLIEIVTGRAVEAELHRPHARILLAQQPNRIAPADVRGVK